MRSWFAKLKISSALDDRKQLSPAMWQRVNASEELRQFVQESAALERALKSAAPQPEIPPALHNSIMRSVRVAERPAVAKPEWSAELLLQAGLAMLVLFCGWWLLRSPADRSASSAGVAQHPLASATTALEMGETMAQTMPVAMVAPLSEEWQRISQDLDKTADFLLASLP